MILLDVAYAARVLCFAALLCACWACVVLAVCVSPTPVVQPMQMRIQRLDLHIFVSLEGMKGILVKEPQVSLYQDLEFVHADAGSGLMV